MDDIETFGDRLSWARLRRGLTQAELSDLCGIATSTIGNLEAGHTHTSRKMPELAAALSVNKDWLVTGIGVPSDAFLATPEIAEWKVRLREARRKKGLTRNDLALLVDVSNSTVTNWEQSFTQGGIKQISEANAEKVSRALGIKKDWLLHGEVRGQTSGDKTGDEETPVESEHGSDAFILVPRVNLILKSGKEVFRIDERTHHHKFASIERSQANGLVSLQPSLVAVIVEDKGLFPVIAPGDEMIINVANIEKEEKQVFAMNVEGVLLIRRLHLESGKWHMATQDGSDKSEMDERHIVVGRVVYRLGSSKI